VPTDLGDVAIILFEQGGNDEPTVQAFDGLTGLGSAYTVQDDDWGDTGKSPANYLSGQNAHAVGITFNDLGLSAGDQITSFQMTTMDGFDPTEIVVAIPEPASLALIGLGTLAMVGRRRH